MLHVSITTIILLGLLIGFGYLISWFITTVFDAFIFGAMDIYIAFQKYSKKGGVKISYSRWGNSRWYTFWRIQDEKTENRDTAIFEICAVTSFTAKELRNKKDKCLEIVSKREVVNEKQLDELNKYMDLFLLDVDNTYK